MFITCSEKKEEIKDKKEDKSEEEEIKADTGEEPEASESND